MIRAHDLAVESVGIRRCTPCTVVLGPPATLNCTRGSTAGASEAQETTTSLEGSAPQVRCTCSGVPSGLSVAALPGTARLPAAPAKPETPASFRKPRRVTAASGSVSEASGVFLLGIVRVLVLKWREAGPCVARREAPPGRKSSVQCGHLKVSIPQMCDWMVTAD